MIDRRAGIAALVAVFVLAGCQTYELQQRGTALDGTWTSTDGDFASTFRNGSFNTRFIDTNEIVGQGTYVMTGGTASLRWISVRDQTQRSATCTLTSATTVRCNQQSGGGFDLVRSA
jgi:hypothetical protein